jgi:hypothetical protein
MSGEPPLRAFARQKFAELFKQSSESGMVINAEVGVYNMAVKNCNKHFGMGACHWGDSRFKGLYKEKLRSLLFNLKNPKNPGFLERVRAKEIGCRHLASLSPEDMFPENWTVLKAKIARNRVIPADLLDEIPDNPFYTCSSCHSKKITSYEFQTLAADQSTTSYLLCQACSYCWKIT